MSELKNIIGLDIKNNAITAVMMSYSKNTYKVTNYSRLELEEGIIGEDSIILQTKIFQEALKELLKTGVNGELKSNKVIIGIPEEKSFSHYLNIPEESLEDYDSILEQAVDFIPIDLSESISDYKIVSENKENKELIIDFTATQKTIIDPLIDILEEINLKIIAVEVDKNSLMRVLNVYAKDIKNTFLVEINSIRTLLSMRTNSGFYHTFSQNIGEIPVIEAMKEKMKIYNPEKANLILKELCVENKEDSDNTKKLKAILDQFIEEIAKKIKNIYKIIKQEENIDLDSVFLIELGYRWPGLSDKISSILGDDIKILSSFKEIEIPELEQRYYFNAIGLALRSLIPEINDKEINLLPFKHKKEIFADFILPKLSIAFTGISILIAILFVFIGAYFGKTYYKYKESVRELNYSQEQLENPHLKEVAKTKQFKLQIASQIEQILSDNIKVDDFIATINKYNNVDKGIKLSTVNYELTKNKISVRLKTMSREATENLLKELKDNKYFSDINSPLSNLIGKGEKFIQLDMTLNKDLISITSDKKQAAIKKEKVDLLDKIQKEEDSQKSEAKESEKSDIGTNEKKEEENTNEVEVQNDNENKDTRENTTE